jgi:hypothetical protein
VLQPIVGTKTRLSLWQNYARCHFDYFSSTIALCGKLDKFERFFNKSLKKALGLPMHLPNNALLRVGGVPSLSMIAAHHIQKTTATIHERYNQCPMSLNRLAATITQAATEYQTLKDPKPIKTLQDGTFLLDILSTEKAFTRDVIGLATGAFLTLRCTRIADGFVGDIRRCTSCLVPATQKHFLNECPNNDEARYLLKQAIPRNIVVPLLSDQDLFTFFGSIRCLPVIADSLKAVENALESIAESAASAASTLIKKTLQANTYEFPLHARTQT